MSENTEVKSAWDGEIIKPDQETKMEKQMEQAEKLKLISIPEPWKFKLCCGLYLFDHGYSFNFFGLWLRLGIAAREPRDVCESWSISYSNNALMFYMGTKFTMVFMPWDLIRIKEDVLSIDETFTRAISETPPHFSKLLDVGAFKDGRLMFEAPYYYVKKDGEIQRTLAAFYVSRSEFKARIFRKVKFGKTKVVHEIKVTFKNEIGEQAGTFKGGVTQCSYEMRDGEGPFDTLNRMNLQRVFP